MKKSESRILKVAGKIVRAEAKKVEAGWPPPCIGFLHQPKRPVKK